MLQKTKRGCMFVFFCFACGRNDRAVVLFLCSKRSDCVFLCFSCAPKTKRVCLFVCFFCAFLVLETIRLLCFFLVLETIRWCFFAVLCLYSFCNLSRPRGSPLHVCAFCLCFACARNDPIVCLFVLFLCSKNQACLYVCAFFLCAFLVLETIRLLCFSCARNDPIVLLFMLFWCSRNQTCLYVCALCCAP